MKSFACSGAAFRAVTVATTLAILLAMVSPATATQSPPVKVGGEVAVSTHTPDTQYYPDAARRPDGKWVVVWASLNQDGSSYGIYMQLYNKDRSPLGGEVQVHTNTQGDQRVPRVAVAADSSFAVVWHSSHPGVQDVQSQRFDSAATKVGGEFTVNTGAGAANFADVTYLASGDVVFCWTDKTTGIVRTMLRRFDANFSPLGAPVEVNSEPSQTVQAWPSIAALTGGGFAIVYTGIHTGSSSYEIKGQMYSATATKVGAGFQINTYTSLAQRNPRAAALPDGGFIVTWDSDGQDGSNMGTVARHFAANGSPLGAEFNVNTHTSGNQYRPKIATFSDNSFVIAWVDEWQSGDDIAMQYFDASHNKVGSQILLNTHTTGRQYIPSIAANWEDGDFVVFYYSHNLKSGSSMEDIAGQWFTADVTPSGQVAVLCTSACLQYFCTDGHLIDIKVTGVVSNDVYGTSHFSDDSNVAAAAVYAGLVAEGEIATVTVRCSGPQSSFDSGTAHGVTTQAFASSWPSSFTFDLAGATHAPSPPAPNRCDREPCVQGKCYVQGTSFDMVVEGAVSNNIWGTEAFADDSFLGAAAVHQGLVVAGSVGSVRVSCTGRRESLAGSTQNGVTSNSFGPWEFTYVVHAGPTAAPAPTTDMCVGACLDSNCPENQELYLRVHGSTWGYLWGGRAPYSADSTVSAAAVHAGFVSADVTGIVKATCTGAQSSFTGSSQNGVTTVSYGPWPESFTLSIGTNMPTVTCVAGDQCLRNECRVLGRVIKVSVTGSTNPVTAFWGTTQYTGDSPLSHAAVHAGLVADGQTAVLYATCQGGHDTYIGSTANGITSAAYNAHWPDSYTLSTAL